MIPETTILGLLAIIIATAFYFLANAVGPALSLLFFGTVLILFGKNENKIEQRRDT